MTEILVGLMVLAICYAIIDAFTNGPLSRRLIDLTYGTLEWHAAEEERVRQHFAVEMARVKAALAKNGHRRRAAFRRARRLL